METRTIVVFGSTGRHGGAVARHLLQAGFKVRAVIIRPVVFMHNFTTPGPLPKMFTWMFKTYLRPDRKLQLVAVDDIGRLAAKAFGEPQPWIGKAISLAGVDLTLPEIHQQWRSIRGKNLGAFTFPKFMVKAMSKDLAAMLDWFQSVGYQADIPTVRRELPGLRSFESFLRQRRN